MWCPVRTPGREEDEPSGWKSRRQNYGIAQWVYLPLHRVRSYEFEILVRSPDTSRQGLARLERDVLAHNPQAVVVLFGTNDTRLDAPGVYVPLPEYEKNISAIIDRCHDIGAEVVLATIPPIEADAYFKRHSREVFDAAGGFDALLARYRTAVLRIAAAKGIPVIDLNQELAGQSEWRAPDGVHPTREGNRTIARLVAEKMRAALGAKGAEESEL